jgi:hypothetical protein
MVGMPVIPAHGRLRQEDGKPLTSLGCIVRLSQQTNKQTNKKLKQKKLIED